MNNMNNFRWHLSEPESSELWCYNDGFFTSEECDKIVDLCEKHIELDKGRVGDAIGEKVDDTIRKSKIGFLPILEDTEWIFRKSTSVVLDINKTFYNYDLEYLETLQYTTYDHNNEFYGKHIDMMYKSFNYRKLSFSLQLSDENEYEGGDLILHTGSDTVMPKKKGMMVLFPSWTLHEVTPVTKGHRKALVGWVCGPRFK